MSDTKNGAAGEGAERATAESAEAQSRATQPAPPLEDQLAQAQAEAAELKDRLLRALAETENARRRAERERQDAARYGVATFARDLLDVADNLRRAIDSAPESQVNDELTRTLLMGVAATERALLTAFERHGIRRIDPKGERFDHNYHQAVFEAENTGRPAGTIVEVLQPGYMLHDRLLRPAMVGVAKADSNPSDPPQRIDTIV